jgi:hypothetical protein
LPNQQPKPVTPTDIEAMPIHRSVETTRISQEDFKPVAYEVMEHVYAILQAHRFP